MASKLVLFIITKFLITKVMSSYPPPYSLNSFLLREPNQQRSHQIPYKPEYKPGRPSFTPAPPQKSYQKPKEYTTAVVPRPVEYRPHIYQISSDYQTPNTVPLPNQIIITAPKEAPKSSQESPASVKCSASLDRNVLNNLAIALQLLILNNIISTPKSECLDTVSPCNVELPTDLSSKSINKSPYQMPNAKFLGSSNFGDDNVMSKAMTGLAGSGIPSPRPGFTLMSPYDSIAASSPFADSVSSLITSKNDFKSPYAAMMNDNDLFSMTDLF